MTISQAKNHLTDCIKLIEKLNTIQKTLEENVGSMSSSEWKTRTVEIGIIKDEFTKIMCKFDNAEVMKHLKVSIRTRKKKRLNDRKRREKKLLEKQEAVEARKKLHKEIDQWLNNKNEEVINKANLINYFKIIHFQLEKIKQEEARQKHADVVLAEVTKKKQEARKQLSFIGALIKLRMVRENVANQRGEKTSLEDRRAFSITTEKLIKMWENSMQAYLKEEQGLKFMLEKNQTEDSKQAKMVKERCLVEQWKTVLFGRSHSVPSTNPTFWALTAAERDLETFIAIRKSWDTFLVSPNNENGSKIPVGWVLPNQELDASWSQYLDRNGT
ncbi:hypothetical protein ABEB36_014092 [Hypothenemus hampei]|uniref:Programmed cell death protein 7 n=1 Tax=Hypothenemus hampei TaxID=57062 RepID=A0ABD1E441_HYPHA